MRTQQCFPKNHPACAIYRFCVHRVSAEAADSRITTFQEGSGTSSENSNRLIGHWRKTTISYTGPVDEHLVLHSTALSKTGP